MCDVENSERPLKSSATDTQSNGWPLKSQVYYRVHCALNCTSKELM